MFVKSLLIVLSVAFLTAGAARMLYTGPASEVSQAKKIDGGYLVRDVIYDSRVIFPASDWKIIDRGHLLHPRTGASFRFAGRAFGQKFKTFFIWGYTSREHQWARALSEITDHDEKQELFLSEWVDRALGKGEIEVTDNLGLAHVILDRSESQGIFVPLVLTPREQTVSIRHETLGQHRFAITAVKTRTEGFDRPILLDTEIYISGFRYHSRMDDWLFFGSYYHVPSHLSASEKQKLQRLFLETLKTLSLNPPKD